MLLEWWLIETEAALPQFRSERDGSHSRNVEAETYLGLFFYPGRLLMLLDLGAVDPYASSHDGSDNFRNRFPE